MSYRLRVSEEYMPELPGSKRVNSTTSKFQGDEAHKPPRFKRTNPRTYKLQEDIYIIIRFVTKENQQELRVPTRSISILQVLQQRTSLHASTKVLLKEWEEPWSSLDYYLPPNFSILRSGNVPKRLSKKRRKHKKENIASQDGPCAKKTDPAYLCNMNPRSRIQASDQGSRSSTADSHRYN
ncbi:hypothetical protein Bca4012_010424 [Brassica carinata]